MSQKQRNSTLKSKADFVRNAGPVTITLTADPKEFSSGSVGFYAYGKQEVKLNDGRKVWVQIGANLTVIGSKDLPAEDPQSAAA